MQYMLIHTGAPDLAGAWDDEAWAALRSWLDETIGSGVSIEGGPAGTGCRRHHGQGARRPAHRH